MDTPTFNPADIVNFASQKDAVNLKAAFDQMVGQKVVDAIQARKIEVATAMFNPPQEDVDQGTEESDQNTTASDEQQSTEANAQEEQAGEEAGEQQTAQETEESDEDTEVTS